jgi:predicted MFS family arabinose efflux permease
MKKSLYSKEFIVFNVVFFLAFINMAVFFHLHQYLLSLSIDDKWSGLIIGAYSLAAVFLQPILSPFIHVTNARRFLMAGLLVTIASLLSYRWATTLGTLMLVRIMHGAGFITFITAMNASIVALIPAARSGQAFSLISVNILLPGAIVPALLDLLGLGPLQFVNVLTAAAILMVPAVVLPILLRGGDRSLPPGTAPVRLGVLQGIGESLRHPGIAVLLVANFFVFLAYTPVFFFLKEYAQGKGIGKPGIFFTISTGTMIAIRLLGGRFFDRINKKRMMLLSLLLLTVAYTLLAKAAPAIFLLLGFTFGLGWSLYAPLLNALLFECSPPSSRGLALNLSMVTLQGGYLVGPTIGTLILSWLGYSGLFIYCGLMPFIAACLVAFAFKGQKGGRTILAPERVASEG